MDDKISNMNELFNKLSQHLELSDLLMVGNKTIMDMLKVDFAGIYLYNTENEELSMNCFLGLDKETLNMVKSVKIRNDITGIIRKSRKPLFFTAESYPETSYKYLFKKLEVKSIWLFPIISDEKVLGILVLVNKLQKEVDEDRLQFVELLCNQLALFIHKSILYNKMKLELEEKNIREKELYESREEIKRAREEAEIAKKLTEQNWIKLQCILKNVDAAVWHIDKNGIITFSEGQAFRNIGLKDIGKNVGRSIFDIHKNIPKVIESNRKVLEGVYCEDEYQIKDSIFYVKYSPIFDHDGNVEGAVSVATDITQRKKIEKIQSLLNEKNREEVVKNEFFANISHELRTPVNVIYSAIQLQSNYVNNLDLKQITKYNKTIKQNCLRLIKLINNIIDITKIESGFLEPVFKIENIVSLVENITLSVANYAEMKNINIVFDTEYEDIYVNCDSNLMERVMLNLLSNSVKYGKENGNVWVNIYQDKAGMVTISVKDDGIGIPKDLEQKIFERFQKVDKSMSRSAEGSGIGLALTKSLVEIQKGIISIKSELNKGTEFFIKLPIVENYQPQSERDEKCEVKEENNIIEKVDVEFSDIYQ